MNVHPNLFIYHHDREKDKKPTILLKVSIYALFVGTNVCQIHCLSLKLSSFDPNDAFEGYAFHCYVPSVKLLLACITESIRILFSQFCGRITCKVVNNNQGTGTTH